MELRHARCCGLDVHKDTVVACVRLVCDGKVTTEVRTFGTTTAELLRLSAWLAESGCTHVAMEATGVYWKPVWHILDDGELVLILANAAHVKNVPGRKTDVNDAMWLAELVAHGLIRPSFVPDHQTQEMRTLLRTRKQLTRESARHIQRVQKTLEDANIKLDSVLSDVMGKSGRAMIEALIAGETNPVKLASLADRQVKASQEELRESLRGRVTKQHRFLLRLHVDQIDALDAAIARIDAEVEAELAPFRAAVAQLISIPGIKKLGAEGILSEIGIDMSRFASAAHLLSWTCICPRNDEERRQASIQSRAQRFGLAQDHDGAMRQGRRQKEGQLSSGAILPHPGAPRRKQGDPGGGSFHAHRHLSHAQGWNDVSGSRPPTTGCTRPRRRKSNG